MVLKEGTKLKAGQKDTEPEAELTPRETWALVVFGVTFVGTLITSFVADFSAFGGYTLGTLPLSLLAVLVASLIGGIGAPFLLVPRNSTLISENKSRFEIIFGLIVVGVFVILLPSAITMGARSFISEHHFKDSIVQQYKTEHHVDAVKMEFVANYKSNGEMAYVYHFTQENGKSDVIEYKGHNGNTPTSIKTLSGPEYKKLTEYQWR